MELDQIKKLWEDPNVTKIAYNAAFECVWLSHVWGWKIKGRIADPLIAVYLLNENLDSYALQSVATRYLHAPEWKIEWEPYKKTLQELSYFPKEYTQPLQKYNEQDIYWTRRLHSYTMPRLCASKLNMLFWTEMENLKTLARMTEWGMKLDIPLLQKWVEKFKKERDDLHSTFPFNPASPQQVLRVLREAGYTLSSSGRDVLSKLRGVLPENLLRFRRLDKILGTYLEGLQRHIYDDGRIHPSYHQYRTVSGRLSSSDPNGQNFPRDTAALPFRELIVGTWGNFVSGDFNQLELRMAAHYAGGKLQDVYRANQDIHDVTGERIWAKRPEQITENERVVSKVTNFTCLYDPFASAIGAVRLQCDAAGIKLSWSDAQDIVKSFRRTYPEWWFYYAWALRQVYDKGQVRASSGRIRRSPLSQGQAFPWGPPPQGDFNGFFDWCSQYDKEGRKLEQEVLRSIVNSLGQGLGADITKLVGTIIDKRLVKLGHKSRLCNNVHDELLIDCFEGEESEVAKIVEETSKYPPVKTAFGFTLNVPLDITIGIGETWSASKKKENHWAMSY